MQRSGIFDIDLRVACDGSGRALSLSIDGVSIANSAPMPNTGGWQTWQTETIEGVSLQEGEHVLRVTIEDTDYINLNYMNFIGEGSTVIGQNLVAGWNLIGYPHMDAKSLDVALSSIYDKVLVVKNYDSFYDSNGSVSLNSLHELVYGMGYLIKVSEDCVLEW